MANVNFIIALSILLILFFTSCNNRQQKAPDTGKVTDTADILKQGDTITARVQKLLLANVMIAMKAGGPGNAVTFCNVHAMPLTDSLAGDYNCRIQRISDKYRNPANKPSATDKEVSAKMISSNVMNPVVISENGRMVYYKPIKIAMPACLKCHGSPGKEVDTKTLEIIRQKYPNDLATGYKEGDFRGLWKITFLGN
ncbi:MAG: DUF3365 domain-containing protein [Bacteroidales bacterium]|nr:DUF3365 domain-containing protein [Bacteroidales bacterium]